MRWLEHRFDVRTGALLHRNGAHASAVTGGGWPKAGRDRALEPIGLTGRRAEWIALASLHGGVFSRAQLSDWLGASRFKVLRLMQAWAERRMVAEETVGGLKVYRVLGAEDVRHRRITSTEVVVRRLLSFDYVIEHPGLSWLPAESEKVDAFEALGIDRSPLPVRVYRGATGGARRYFPRGMPVALDSRRAVFVHADSGYDTSTALHSWRCAENRISANSSKLQSCRHPASTETRPPSRTWKRSTPPHRGQGPHHSAPTFRPSHPVASRAVSHSAKV